MDIFGYNLVPKGTDISAIDTWADEVLVKVTVSLNSTKLSNEGKINSDKTWNYTYSKEATCKKKENTHFVEGAKAIRAIRNS